MSRDDVGYDPWREYVAPVIDPHAGNRDRDGNVMRNTINTAPHVPSLEEILAGKRADAYTWAANSGDLASWYLYHDPHHTPERYRDPDGTRHAGERSR